MDILKIKNDRDLLNKEVKLVGTVIASFATNMGWWLKVVDNKNYSIFVFSPKYNFNINDRIVARGILNKNDLYGRYVQGTRVLRRQAAPVKVVNRYVYVPQPSSKEKIGLLSKIDPKIMILIAVGLSIIAGFFLYPILSRMGG